MEGVFDGIDETGTLVGRDDVGIDVGDAEGTRDGVQLGELDGTIVGVKLGTIDGTDVG